MTALSWEHIHFIGIGGAGMSGLAMIAAELGVRVTGSDAAVSKNVDFLADRGIATTVGHSGGLPGSPSMVVYSTAVQTDNPELARAAVDGVPLIRRGEFLALLADRYSCVVAVAGSHGKTTVTGMLCHILIAAGREPGYLIGGRVVGRHASAAAGRGELFVTEVDESDGTQAAMRCAHGIITNIEDDHAWSLGGIEQLHQCFSDFADGAEYVLAGEAATTRELLHDHPNVEFLSPSGIPEGLTLRVPGPHNLLNAAFAVCIAVQSGVPEADAIQSLGSFEGIDRRLSVRWRHAGIRLVDDYAHHPTEVRAGITALREQYPACRLRIVFQPHRYERIARYAADFACELSLADETFIMPVFNAWVNDQDLADPRRIADAITTGSAEFWDDSIAALATRVADTARSGDVIAIMGAGDIDQIIPLMIDQLEGRWGVESET